MKEIQNPTKNPTTHRSFEHFCGIIHPCSLNMDGRAWKRTIIFPNNFIYGLMGCWTGPRVSTRPAHLDFPGKKVPFSRSFVDIRAGLLKRSTRADCKSAAFGLRRFESFTQHSTKRYHLDRKRTFYFAKMLPCLGAFFCTNYHQ